LYLQCRDRGGLQASFQSKGTWTITSGPSNVSLSPASGSTAVGAARSLTAAYQDPNGYGDVASVYLLVNASASAAGALYGWYDAVNNKLYLRNNANSTWLGGFAPGTANTIVDGSGQGSL